MHISEDPTWHWNGTQWLHWDGLAWVLADPQPDAPSLVPPPVETLPEPASSDADHSGLRDDIESAKARMATKFGGKRELKKLQEHVWPDERVERMATGSYGGGLGLLVMTDRRLIFIKEGRMSSTLEDFPFDKISSIQWSTGMLTGKIAIFLSGNKGEIENVSKIDGKALADDVRARISNLGAKPAVVAPAAPQVVVNTTPSQSPLELMQQLEQMKSAGYLTDEEYAAKKADILSRM